MIIWMFPYVSVWDKTVDIIAPYSGSSIYQGTKPLPDFWVGIFNAPLTREIHWGPWRNRNEE